MTAEEVLAELLAAGAQLWAEGDRLRYRAPAGAITSDLRAAAAEHRDEIRQLVADPVKTCAVCGSVRQIMLAMEPGEGGQPWALCARCWR